jgi:hypothetical protein
LGLLDDLHFFECSGIFDPALHLGNDMLRRPRNAERLAFLPAPRTWIEFLTPSSKASARTAFLLEEDGDAAAVRNIFLDRNGDVTANVQASLRLPLMGSKEFGTFQVMTDAWRGSDRIICDQTAALIYAFLAMINTPRIIGRRQHMPHAGLQRQLARARGMVGMYPLRAWQEIVLGVSPPRSEADNEPRETRLTGEKALHFVRCHLRIRLGMLELVTAHWRGDAALGIKQTRYRLVA